MKCFIGSRRNSGIATLVDIFKNPLDFSYLPKGFKSPKMRLLKRVSSRKTCVIYSKSI